MMPEAREGAGGGEGVSASRRETLQAVCDSLLQRWRCGEQPALEDCLAQHPDLASELREAFAALAFLGRFPARGETPPDGDLDTRSPSPAPAPLLIRLGGLRLIREIGRGGMGVVFEAEDEALQRRVAVKVLPFHALQDAGRIERFRREARAAAALQHPGIVPVYGAGTDRGIHFYSMQYIEGQSLDEVLTEVRRLRSGEGSSGEASRSARIALALLSGSSSTLAASLPLSPSQRGAATLPQAWPAPGKPLSSPAAGLPADYFQSVARIAFQASAALNYAHGRGILHRDIKPGNIILDLEGNPWITDFGLARPLEAEKLTRTGEIVGTLRYMAPECFQGRSDARSDVFSLGLTLNELLTLEPPGSGGAMRPELDSALASTPASLQRRAHGMPRHLEEIVLKAIQYDPELRYSSAGELAADLEKFLGGRPVLARLPGRPPEARRLRRRNRVVLALVLATLSCGAAISWAVWSLHRPLAPECLVLADLDGDSDLDIATANGSSASLSVLRNRGSAAFSPAGHFETGPVPVSLTTGDFDGDGRLDLAAGSLKSSRLTLLRGLGNSVFRKGEPREIGAATVRLAAADIDGDAILDLIATTADNRIAVLRGGKEGLSSTPVFTGTIPGPGNLALSDLDHDGDLDLAVASMAASPTKNVAVHRNNSSGAFSAPQTLDLGGFVWALRIHDLDGDGNPDIAVCFDALSQITILWNDGRAGLQEKTIIALPSVAVSLAIADFDGDGKPDIASASGLGAVLSLHNLGRREFEIAARLGTGEHPLWAEAGDLNGDGRPDLIVSNGQSNDLTLFLNEGNGSFAEKRAVSLHGWWPPQFLTRQ